MVDRLFTVEQVEAHNKRVREHRGRESGDLMAADTIKPKKNNTPTAAAEKPKPEYETWLENQLLSVGVTGMEVKYLWCRGRKFEGDIVFPDPAIKLLVEIDGAPHRIKAMLAKDIEKSQLALLQGWTLLRVSPKDVRNGEACKLVKQVLAMLMAKGVPF